VKRIYVCTGIFVLILAFTAVSEFYVARAVDKTTQMLVSAIESREAGDYEKSKEYADTAWESWRELTRKSSLVISDLTIVSDVTVSLSRVTTLSLSESSENNERFIEECTATIIMLEHFLADNQDVSAGSKPK
jgi:hypothetical protein